MKTSTVLATLVLGACLQTSIACAQQSPAGATRGLSQASTASVNASLTASGLLVHGSAQVLAASGELAIASIVFTGETALLVLKGASQAAEVSVQVGASVVRELGLAVGTVLVSASEVVGYALYAGAKLVAYVPNEVGRAMLHQSRLN